MLRLKTFSVIIHLACWLLFMALPLLFVNGRSESSSILVLLASPYYWLFCLTYVSIFYLNSSLMFPLFFLKKRYVGYAIICVCLLSALYFLKPFERLLRNSEGWRSNMDMQQQQGRQQFRPPPGDNLGLNGQSPNSAMQALKPDLVILDYLLLNDECALICRDFKEDAEMRGVPLIVVTAYKTKKTIDDAYKCEALFVKPLDVSLFASSVNYLMAS
ncbi:CheY-like chemotaxis protein [Mucilaginibacter sp. UYNi724]